MAEGKNNAAFPLLPGEVLVAVQGALSIRIPLPYVAPGGELKICLGRDERVRAKKELLRTFREDVGFGGKRERFRYHYRITVSNHTPEEIALELRDPLPVSKDERVKVKIEKLDPPPKKRDERGIGLWEILLPPQSLGDPPPPSREEGHRRGVLHRKAETAVKAIGLSGPRPPDDGEGLSSRVDAIGTYVDPPAARSAVDLQIQDQTFAPPAEIKTVPPTDRQGVKPYPPAFTPYPVSTLEAMAPEEEHLATRSPYLSEEMMEAPSPCPPQVPTAQCQPPLSRHSS